MTTRYNLQTALGSHLQRRPERGRACPARAVGRNRFINLDFSGEGLGFIHGHVRRSPQQLLDSLAGLAIDHRWCAGVVEAIALFKSPLRSFVRVSFRAAGGQVEDFDPRVGGKSPDSGCGCGTAKVKKQLGLQPKVAGCSG